MRGAAELSKGKRTDYSRVRRRRRVFFGPAHIRRIMDAVDAPGKESHGQPGRHDDDPYHFEGAGQLIRHSG